jgi:hypothetical protein
VDSVGGTLDVDDGAILCEIAAGCATIKNGI